MASSQEIVQINEIDKGLTTLNTTITATTNNYLKLVKTISDGSEVVKNSGISYEKLNTEHEKTKKYSQEIDALGKRLAASEQRLKDLTDERTKALIANNLEAQKQTTILKQQTVQNIALDGSYDKLNATLNETIGKYKALSQADRENVAIGGEMIKNIQAQDAQLKQLDATMGRNQRNVGNYKSGFNGLNFSIMQIGRELPSLAYGFQVFVGALSNNIPMMTDEIKKAKAQVAILKAEGQAFVPVWKQILTAIVSWQTLMVVGITLITLYGREIATWTKELFKGRDAVNSLSEAMEKQNKSAQDLGSEMSKEKTSMKLNFLVANDLTRSYEERLAAATKLISKYPSILGNYTAEQLLAGKLKGTYDDLTLAIEKSFEARFAETKILENYKEMAKQQKIIEEGGTMWGKFSRLTVNYTKDLDGAKNKIIQIKEENKKLFEQFNVVSEQDRKDEEEAAKKAEESAKDAIKEQEKRLKQFYKVGRMLNETIKNNYLEIDKEIVKSKSESIDKIIKDAEKGVKEQIENEKELQDETQKYIDEWLKGEEKKLEAAEDFAEKRMDLEKELIDVQREFLLTAVDSVFSINQSANEKELEELQAQYDAKLAIIEKNEETGLYTKEAIESQKLKISKDYALKEEEIQRKQKNADKIQKSIEVGIQTAKSIFEIKAAAAVLLSNPFTAALAPLALAQIPFVLGSAAFSLAAIAAFEKGTNNAPSEFIAGEKGRELMFLRSGETMMADRPTYFKGSKFQGAQIISNPETEKMIKLAGDSGLNGRSMTDDRLLNEMKSVKRAIQNKPVAIFDQENKQIGFGTSHHQTIYLNKLIRRN